MEKQILQVRAFTSVIGNEMPEKPTMLEGSLKELRQKLLEEEVKEMKDAKTIDEFADGVCDSMYVLIGTAIEYGLADRLTLMFDEVHRSNMSKFPNGEVVLREDGKVMKPDSFSPPNLKSILNRRYHLFNENNATFAESLKAIGEAEQKKWDDVVDAEIMKSLNWVHRMMAKFSSFLERTIKNKVTITSGVDESYRRKVTIKAYGKEKDIVDF